MEVKREYERLTAAEVVARWDSGQFALWSGNRHVTESRVARIAAEVAQGCDFGPMPIVIGRIPTQKNGSGGGFVIDGQHRLRAAKLLSAEVAARTELCICWEECKTDADLKRLFRKVNCGTPVPPSHWDDDVLIFSRGLAQAIRHHWCDSVISDKDTCCRPRITEAALFAAIDDCRETREAAALRRLSVESALEKIVRMNTLHKSMYTGDGARRALSDSGVKTAAMFESAKKLKFYVGLRFGWLSALMAELSEEWLANGAP